MFRTASAAALFVLLVLAAVGCGGGSQTTQTGPQSSESTLLNVTVSSSANNRLSLLDFPLQSLTLTDQAGNSVNLLSATRQIEFIHLDGNPEPLVAISVPQGVYTSAAATVGQGAFVCVTQDPLGTIASDEYPIMENSTVTVNLPSPLRVEGSVMNLSLQLQVSQSVSFPQDCYDPSNDTWSSTPTFTLATANTAMQTGASATLTALDGVVTALGSGNSFQVISADGTATVANPVPGNGVSVGIPWQVTANSNTLYQGISSFSALTVGTAVDMDGVVQSDGSLVATRIAVADPSTTNLTVDRGAVVSVASSVPVLSAMQRQNQGGLPFFEVPVYYSFGSAAFGVWGGLNNLQSLPFTPTFTAANMVAGQDVSITTHSTAIQPYPLYIPATTVTLMPQTIDGTVESSSSAGGFTTYSVSLAAYDVFPQFAVQGGQTTLLQNPSQMVIYVDSNTQMLNQQPVIAGSAARFTGVVFNDSGTLRMDCTSVSDGVPE